MGYQGRHSVIITFSGEERGGGGEGFPNPLSSWSGLGHSLWVGDSGAWGGGDEKTKTQQTEFPLAQCLPAAS